MDEQTIYLGPNIPSLGLLRNQVYLGGLPGQVRAALTICPEIEQLIFPVSELTEALKKVQTKGTHEHHIYMELQRKAGKA
ncbi:MAG: hypothetical protein IJS39_04535 [Synergistaceae bacterium]|nr:hypothetical protein [Synergistaceae bacterium]